MTVGKRRPGDALRIGAGEWNEIAAAVNAQTGLGFGRTARGSSLPEGVVEVLNAAGTALTRFQPVKITSPIIDPADDVEAFNARAAFSVDAVDANDMVPGSFAIALEPIADGDIGRALLFGVRSVAVNMLDASDRYARVVDGSAVLESASVGAVPIVWVQSGTGVKSAVVALFPTIAQLEIEAVITGATAIAGETGRWAYAWTEVFYSGPDAETFDEARTSEVDGPAYNRREAGNTASGTQGNGVDRANLVGTFDLVPLGVGAGVRLRGPYYDPVEDENFWLFGATNGVDGVCG